MAQQDVGQAGRSLGGPRGGGQGARDTVGHQMAPAARRFDGSVGLRRTGGRVAYGQQRRHHLSGALARNLAPFTRAWQILLATS